MSAAIASVSELINAIIRVIINPLIALLFAFAFIIALWGGFEFIIHSGEAGEEHERGKRNLLFGIIGIFIMVSVLGLLSILGNTFGFCDRIPGGCV